MKNQLFSATHLLAVIFIFLNQNSFAKGKETPFYRDGISFSIAESWKVIASDSVGDNAYYFSAERVSYQATGLITVAWINKMEDPQKMIEVHQKSMKAANIYRNPGIEFTAIENEIFSGLKVRSCHYITFVKEQKLEGVIYSFNVFPKTITIFFQTGIKDKKLNQKGFDLFKQTFNCREN